MHSEQRAQGRAPGTSGTIRAAALALSLFFSFFLFLTTPVPASERRDLFVDDEDGAFDMSDLLLTERGFLPIPLLITEPAVGYGLGVVPVWFHEPPRVIGVERKQLVLPSASALGGFATADGSWGAFGGHLRSWNDDTWRYVGAVGYVDLDLAAAGVDGSPDGGSTTGYNIESFLTVHEISRRLGTWFRVGARYRYIDSQVAVDAASSLLSGDSRIGGLGLLLSYDVRDNLVSPSRGWRLDLRPSYQAEWLGGDTNYSKVTLRSSAHWLIDRLRVAFKVDAGWAGDDAPFYDLPFIQLRGVPVLAYPGEYAASLEAELGWDLSSRWTVLGFAGAGIADNAFPWSQEAARIEAGGVGFRYLLARKFGLRAGTDLAISSGGELALYVIVGSAWW